MENFVKMDSFLLKNLTFYLDNIMTNRRNEWALSYCEPIYNQSDPKTNFKLTLVGCLYFLEILNLPNNLHQFYTWTIQFSFFFVNISMNSSNYG